MSQRVSKMGWQDGFRVVWLDLKGGTPHPMALPPETARRVDRYLASRGVGNQVAVRGDRAGHPTRAALIDRDHPQPRGRR